MPQWVPNEMQGWRAEGPDATYDRQTLFQHLDGAAELYLTYGFRQVFVRRFSKANAPSLSVEIYDMGSSAEAYGIFSFEREEESKGLGQGYEYAAGWLRFWKGPYFVSVLSQPETPESKQAVLALGAAIAAAIPAEGPPPDLLAFLPAEGLIPDSVRFFHTHPALNYHYFVADQNILHLDKETEAVLARYKMGGDRPFLLMLRYPTGERAQAARESFVAAYLPEGPVQGRACLENGKWTAIESYQRFVVIVLDAPQEETAQDLLEACREKLGGKKP